MDTELVSVAVGTLLRLAGVPASAAAAVGRMVPVVVAWAKVAIDGNRDPEAELKAMLDTAEAQADLAARAKFGA